MGLRRILKVYSEYGIYGVIYHFHRVISKETNLGSINDFIINKLKIKILNEILSFKNKKIISGIYKDVTFISSKEAFNKNQIIYYLPQLLGTYEEQIQKKIKILSKRYSLNTIINFGAGEGYHIVSSIKKNFFKKGIAFEICRKDIKVLKKNIKLNKIRDKIKVFNNASFFKVAKNLSKDEIKKTLFLIDIEGTEFEIFNNNIIKKFFNSYFIIEDHSELILPQIKKNIEMAYRKREREEGGGKDQV